LQPRSSFHAPSTESGVGTPVNWSPRHRPGRAVFPASGSSVALAFARAVTVARFMPDKTPRRHAAVSRLPVRSLFYDSTRAHALSGLFTRSCPSPVGFIISLRSGAFGASRVLWRLSSCMPRPDDSGGRPHARPRRVLHALQGARSPLRPTGFSVYACPVFCSRLTPLRNRTNTRYGWMASPYPTGTFTRQETPRFARRDNDNEGEHQHIPIFRKP
jgi:hypothetical protein